MTNSKIRKEEPISGDRHPQSENYIKMVAIICSTLVFIFIVSIVFYSYYHGNKEMFEWFKNIQIWFSGFLSALGIFGIKVIYKLLKNE